MPASEVVHVIAICGCVEGGGGVLVRLCVYVSMCVCNEIELRGGHVGAVWTGTMNLRALKVGV